MKYGADPLVITINCEEVKRHGKLGYVQRTGYERSFGSFSRKLRLPVDIQIDKTHALFKDGVLEIRMPKSEAAKRKTRKITVD